MPASILTGEQRAEYADLLAMGIPEDIVKELDEEIDDYIRQWKQALLAHARKSDKPAST